MLKQKEILKAAISLLKTKYTCKIYTDEVVEGFKQPCFFIKLIKQRNTETKSITSDSVSLIINYFADAAANKQLAFIDCEDDIDQLFSIGFQVGKRYLHVKSIHAERIGEKQDILQVNISIDYLDSTGYDPDYGYDLMKDLKMNMKNQY
ncbi:phage tail terminator family protein [Anaerosinus massiliensis]|uniref:phage tail terminator family protein n=1 Tax=Massilibacillus massiliensis TaxID=1806837 RepID=UPI000DA5F50E|nr:hypothetical protein [Massilibacillus massiliensis]